jgi:C4-dicarboxylate-specific signal transduction histidine kinase
MMSVLLRRSLEATRPRVVALSGVFFVLIGLGSAGVFAAGAGMDLQDLPQTLWTEYRRFTLAALMVFLVQLVWIGALLVSVKRRARAELALRRSEARNTAILRAMPDLMFVLSSDGVYLDYHARDERDLFVPPEEFLGKHLREVFPYDLARLIERHVRQAATSSLPVVVEYTLPILDTERHYEARLVRCDNDTVMSVVRDVTSKHQAQEELHKAHAELAHAARLRALGAMAAGIAHEVSQPISAVLLNAHSCLNSLNASELDVTALREAVADIVSDGKRARDVITRIRGLVKHTPLRTAPVSMNDIVDDVITLSRRMLRERRVRLQLGLTSDLPHVVGDRIQLQQILLNLVLNAVDAMQAVNGGPRVLAIHSDRAADGVVVRVKDSGHGISRDHLDDVFKPFFTTKDEGMGMGLSISRSIAETHGGQLRIAENSSEGMTFELELPVASERERVTSLATPATL